MSIGALHTTGGYRFDETFSALQKCIRAADERGALYWAIELETEFSPHLWNRLEIISHEDIGLANPALIVFVATCKTQYKEMRKNKNSAFRLVLSNVILAMCRSPKCRQADTFCNAVYRSDEYLAIPDIAKDKHTAAGRKMGRGWDHFFNFGVVCKDDIFGQGGVDDPYREESNRYMTEGKAFKGVDPKNPTKALVREEQGPNGEATRQLGFGGEPGADRTEKH